jgi:hypothetical protein
LEISALGKPKKGNVDFMPKYLKSTFTKLSKFSKRKAIHLNHIEPINLTQFSKGDIDQLLDFLNPERQKQ